MASDARKLARLNKPRKAGLTGRMDYGIPGAGPGTSIAEQRAASQAYLEKTLGPEAATIQRPRRFLRRVLKGKGPALARLAMLKEAGETLGYGKEKKAVSTELQDSLAAGSPVDLHHEERPTYDTRQAYIGNALHRGETTGRYLDPAYEASMRGLGLEGVHGATAEAYTGESSRLAAAGMDPRSGVANQRALQISRLNQQGRAGVERDIAGANFDRQRELESEAGQQAGLEEAGRHFDTASEQQRKATVEGGLGSLAGLDERGREYDVNYTESQRQAELARIANRKAAKAMEPTDLEKWSGGVGGFIGGATGS